jgi:hypothetical protein
MVGKAMRLVILGAAACGVFATAIAVSGTIKKPKTVAVETDRGVDPHASLQALRVPAITEAVECEDGWVGFSNPLAGYTLCYPEGWGFSDLTSPTALVSLRGTMLGSIRLLSADLFPWRPGTFVTTALLDQGGAEVQLSLVQDGSTAGATDDCEPTEQVGEASLCTQRVSAQSGLLDAEGEISETFGILPATEDAEGDVIIRIREPHAKRGVAVKLVSSFKRTQRVVN